MADDDIVAGSVAVDINATTRGFIEKLDAELTPGVRKLAQNLSDVLATKIAQGISKGLGQGFAPAETVSRQKGRASGESFGGEFGRQAQSRIRAALAALPKAEIGVATNAAEQKLKDLRAQLATLSDKRIGVDVDSGSAIAELAQIEFDLRSIGLQSPEVDIQVNTAKAIAELAAFRVATAALTSGGPDAGAGLTAGLGSVPKVASSAATSMASMGRAGPYAAAGVAALSTALIPLAGALGGVIVALSAPLGAAAVGGSLFAVLAGKHIADTNKVAKQIDELREKAKTLQDPAAAQAALDQARALEKSLTGPQRAFLAAKENLSKAFDEFTDGPAGEALLKPIVAVLDALAEILPATTPLIVEVSDAITDVIESASGSGKIEGFIDKIAPLAGDAIRTSADILGSLGRALDAVLTAATPAGEAALDGIAGALENLADYLDSPEGQQELQEFFDWLMEHGPDIAHDVGSVVTAFADLITYLAPFGEQVLDLIGFVAEAVSAFYNFADAIGATTQPILVLASVFALGVGLILELIGSLIEGWAAALDVLGDVPGFGWAEDAADKLKGAAKRTRELADEARDVPREIGIKFPVDTRAARRQIQLLIQQLRILSSVIPGAGAFGAALNFAIPENARGTDYFEGGWTKVGEEGVELVRLPEGSAIYPHEQSMEMARTATPIVGQSAAVRGVGGSLSMTITNWDEGTGYIEGVAADVAGQLVDDYDSHVDVMSRMPPAVGT